MAEIPVLEPASKSTAAAKGTAKGTAAAKETDAAASPPTRKRPTLLIIIGAAVVVLGGGGTGAWFMFAGHPTPAAHKHASAPNAPPVYVPLDPPFVVNFEAQQLVRFLQVTVQLMTRDPETVVMLHNNDPVIRNDLLLLLGNQRYEVISTREGKESLRQQALQAVRRVVSEAGGKPDNVEAVYFTSFVMQ